jgi:hypothetical protein
MKVYGKDNFLVKVKALLEVKRLLPVVVQIGGDVNRLIALGINVVNSVEIMDLAKEIKSGHKQGYGVKPHCAHFRKVGVGFNVNTGIRKLNWHNFGHIYRHYVDRIQLRMLEIFGVGPFSCHVNQLLFKPIKGFVAVGIGPLNYHSDYVETR